MQRRLRLLITLTILTVMFGAIASTANAQQYFLHFDSVQLDTCSNTSWTARLINVTFNFDPALGHRIWYGTVKPDGTSQANTSSLNNQTSPVASWGVGYSFGSVPYPYTTSFWYYIASPDGTLGRSAVRVTCTGPNEGIARVISNSFYDVFPPDDRINWGHGDFNAVAYARPAENNTSRFELYCWDESTQLSTLAFVVTQADVDAIGSPAENTLVASAPECGAYFYVLAGGGFQFNVYTVDELYIMIADSLNFDGAERQVFKG